MLTTAVVRARWARIVGLLALVHGVVLAFILYTPITEWAAQPLYLQPGPVSRADAIVVLEAWAFDDGALNESGLNRTLRGSELYRRGVATTVVITGAGPSESRPVSSLPPMTHLLVLGGVPHGAIVVEDASRNTYESAVHVASLARARGWKRLVLVTDASHMRRAMLAFRKQGLDVTSSQTMPWKIGGAQPALRVERVGIMAHEYGGILYYWWRGWI